MLNNVKVKSPREEKLKEQAFNQFKKDIPNINVIVFSISDVIVTIRSAKKIYTVLYDNVVIETDNIIYNVPFKDIVSYYYV